MVLARGVAAVLVVWTLPLIFLLIINPHQHPGSSALTLKCLFVSLTFATIVWALRAATPGAALLGGLICFHITVWTGQIGQPLRHSGLTPLMTLFVLTFLASRFGRRFAKHGIAPREFDEEKKGRSAAQVAANLGVAAMAAIATMGNASGFSRIILVAALAEATADTVSSEIGAAFGGQPWLITSFERVEAGTDGGVSALGTFAGIAAAAVVVASGVWAIGLPQRAGWILLAGGVAGLLFDSLLGATLERDGRLGNDWVNFLSTVFAGVTAWAFALLL